MRRLFRSGGSAAGQDVVAAADVGASSEDANDQAAWLAYRRAKKIRDFFRKEGIERKKAKKRQK